MLDMNTIVLGQFFPVCPHLQTQKSYVLPNNVSLFTSGLIYRMVYKIYTIITRSNYTWVYSLYVRPLTYIHLDCQLGFEKRYQRWPKYESVCS